MRNLSFAGIWTLGALLVPLSLAGCNTRRPSPPSAAATAAG